jgi:excisionase family DNA binding protein
MEAPMPESVAAMKSELGILTVHEVAEYLRISEAKVYRLVKQHRIPVVRIGRTWRFRKDLLDKWLIESAESSVHAQGK